MLEIDGPHFLGVGPDCAIGEAGRKLEGEALIEAGQIALEEPRLLGEIRVGALFVLIGNDAAWVAAGCARYP